MRNRVIWFTGLSGAGKTTLALATKKALEAMHLKCIVLDGDQIRKGLCSDLGFSETDRSENVRRVVEVAKLFLEEDFFVLVSVISPHEKDRKNVRELVGESRYCEVYVSTPLHVCEKRDLKGLYKKAHNSELHNFTGISSNYEAPKNPHLVIDTSKLEINQAVSQILAFVK